MDPTPDLEIAGKFQLFVQKLNACVNHLEQFPIKMYDMTTGSSGVKSAGSTLRFFKTHHLKCSLQRHPDCTSLKSWKGGLVKIDPLATLKVTEAIFLPSVEFPISFPSKRTVTCPSTLQLPNSSFALPSPQKDVEIFDEDHC